MLRFHGEGRLTGRSLQEANRGKSLRLTSVNCGRANRGTTCLNADVRKRPRSGHLVSRLTKHYQLLAATLKAQRLIRELFTPMAAAEEFAVGSFSRVSRFWRFFYCRSGDRSIAFAHRDEIEPRRFTRLGMDLLAGHCGTGGRPVADMQSASFGICTGRCHHKGSGKYQLRCQHFILPAAPKGFRRGSTLRRAPANVP